MVIQTRSELIKAIARDLHDHDIAGRTDEQIVELVIEYIHDKGFVILQGLRFE